MEGVAVEAPEILNGTPLATSESVIHEFVERELSNGKRFEQGVSHGPLPFIIGITGHRDLRDEDLPKLEEMLRIEYRNMQSRYPSTSFILLSGLADGADRLCARVAVELGLRLIAVLPLPQVKYEEDFDEESLVEFRELLAKAEHHFELPVLDGYTLDQLAQHTPERNLHYAQLGAYISSRSTILVALWDGVPLTKIGGTSQVIRYKLEGIPEPFAPKHSELDVPDSGPVYHIMTPRKSNPTPIGTPFAVERLYPPTFKSFKEASHAYRDIYDRMEAFNRDALHYSDTLKEHRLASKEYVFPSDVRAKLPRSLRELLDFYSIADVLSQRFQKRTFTTHRLLLIFVFCAATAFEFYSNIIAERYVIGLYLLTFVFSFISFYVASRRSYQSKYLDYRALAEGLRVQFFWKLSGIKDSAADYYLRKQKSELDWIRNAVRSCMTETGSEKESGQAWGDKERLELVHKYWVEDQTKYFVRAARRDHERVHKNERYITISFATALTLAGIQFILAEQNQIIVTGIALFPILAALIDKHLQKNALSELSKQYERMSGFYHRAQLHLRTLIDGDQVYDAQRFIAELGREALEENGDWILTHRERPLEVPTGA